MPCQRAIDACNDVFLAHLRGRQIDRDAHLQALVEPDARLAAGVIDDPLADAANQAEALGNRNEHCWRHHAASRVLPAQQRLSRGDLACRGVDFRLVVELELLALEREAKVTQEVEALACVIFHRRREEAESATTRALGGIHRRIGARDQFGMLAVVGVESDAD